MYGSNSSSNNSNEYFVSKTNYEPLTLSSLYFLGLSLDKSKFLVGEISSLTTMNVLPKDSAIRSDETFHFHLWIKQFFKQQ